MDELVGFVNAIGIVLGGAFLVLCGVLIDWAWRG